MSERKTKEQLEQLKKKYNVNEIFSWSRYNSYKNDPYGYMLRYIKKIPPVRKDVRWGSSGGACHNIIEKFYSKEITYDEMITLFEEELFTMDMAELKYHRKDAEKNEKMAEKYEENIRLFFLNHEPIKYKMKIEQFIMVKIGSNAFQGYIDFVYKNPEDGTYTIVDWKSSTRYVGSKIDKEKGQLVLYAEGLRQLGIPLEKIKICWCFLKYLTCNYETVTVEKLEDGTKRNKQKSKHCFRNEWVFDISKEVAKWLKKLGYEENEIEELINEAIELNSLENLPEEVQSKFKVSDCYVYIPLTEEVIEELKENIIDTIDEIHEKTKEFEKTGNDELFWSKIDKTNEFFFHNLCEYNTIHHKPYKEYLETLELFLNKENKEETKDLENLEDDWLKDL